MTTLIILSIITILLLWYALQGRDWLKSKPWPWVQEFFARVEPIEIFLFKKSETILVARLLQGLGGVLTLLQYFNGVDLTPILPLVPLKYQFFLTTLVNCVPLLLNVIGAIIERLRNKTTKPIELVAVPDKVVAESPKLQEAFAMAETTKVEAVAVTAAIVQQAKAA